MRRTVTNPDRNITFSQHHVSLQERWQQNGHASGILWFTGLSGSGKTTLALNLERRLFDRGWHACVLDGDNVRHGLSSDLGFSQHDREENIRRIGEVAKLFALSGVIVITAFISPYRSDRDRVRNIAPDMFREVHIDASLEVCERRDPKGLYVKARQGLIADFTGISAPYETPHKPELRVPTQELGIADCLDLLETYAVESFGREG
ncbi:adenosine 5'-phosphosulfate kinase [Rhodospirillaceae bacterium LM-1]|nr:adenosine 5'-phosphosulfate kinase [Rhodospirillaceae bacterium LM-1]